MPVPNGTSSCRKRKQRARPQFRPQLLPPQKRLPNFSEELKPGNLYTSTLHQTNLKSILMALLNPLTVYLSLIIRTVFYRKGMNPTNWTQKAFPTNSK